MNRQLAGIEDLQRSLEPDGRPTDVYRLMASKALSIPYSAVSERQRDAAKKASLYLRYHWR